MTETQVPVRSIGAVDLAVGGAAAAPWPRCASTRVGTVTTSAAITISSAARYDRTPLQVIPPPTTGCPPGYYTGRDGLGSSFTVLTRLVAPSESVGGTPYGEQMQLMV